MSKTLWRRVVALLATCLFTTLLTVSPAAADLDAPIDLTCNDGTLAALDGLPDAVAEITMPFAVNIGDVDGAGDPVLDDTVWIHEDGVVSFEFAITPWSDFFDLGELARGDNEVIAPLYANATGGTVSYGAGTYQGQSAFCVEWTGMLPDIGDSGVLLADPAPTNTYQLVLVDRGDRAVGDFDVIVNYAEVQWDDSYCPRGGLVIPGDVQDRQLGDGCCTDTFIPEAVQGRQLGEGPCCDIEGEIPCCDFQFDELCCEFNPQFCEFGIGRSVFPEFEAAPGLAGMALPSGDFSNGRVVEFPGSGRVDAMIGPDGLAENTLNSLQTGRYVIEVEGGFEAELARIAGLVIDEAGAPVADSLVSVCTDAIPSDCAFTRTGELGDYAVGGALAQTDYIVTARAPAGITLFDNNVSVRTTFTSIDNVADTIVLSGPKLPDPDKVTFGPTRSWGSDTTVYWGEDLDLSVTGCPAGTAAWVLTASAGPSPLMGELLEFPAESGTYSGTVPALNPTHGNASIEIVIDCPGDIPDETTDFTLYIDPAGTVREVHSDEVIDGVTVTLFRRGAGELDFTQVPDGSDIMDPSNRDNPFVTDADGLFSWNVIPGDYRVEVAKAGCDAIALPAAWANARLTEVAQIDGEIDGQLLPPASETPILVVTPEWLDLDLYLDCNNAPTIVAGGPVTVEGPASIGDIAAPVTSDLDPADVANLVVGNDAPAPLPLGDTTVTWTVTDPSGASAADTQTVTVQDTTAPTLSVADVEATSSDGNPVAVDFTVGVSDAYPGATASCTAASGDLFAVGVTQVDCTGTDASGNEASGSFTVTVIDGTPVDTTAPVLTIPTGIEAVAADEAGVVVDFEASAIDDVDGAVAVTCDPASGSVFTVGTTSVTCTAADAAGNSASDSFDVVVEAEVEPPGTTPRQTIRDVAAALADTSGLSRSDRWRAIRASWFLRYTDQDRYWRDDNQVSDRNGWRAMYFMRIAVSYIDAMTDERFADEGNQLLDAMRTMAVSKIDEAVAGGGLERLIERAEYRVTIGDNRRAAGSPGAAGNNYRQAWNNARVALLYG